MGADEDETRSLSPYQLAKRYPIIRNDEQLTETIIGAAMKVLNKLSPGLDEKLYERALIIRFVPVEPSVVVKLSDQLSPLNPLLRLIRASP